MHLTHIVGEVFRRDGRRVLAGLIHLTGDFDAAEDALQEACARALDSWRRDGVPDNPGAWLNTVARRIAIDRFRRTAPAALPEDLPATEAPDPADDDSRSVEDDRLRLLFVCCHPALPDDGQRALALRTLGGLTTKEIARAFVEPESTTAQRIVRAKRKIRDARIPFEVPAAHRLAERTESVLAVLYSIFNEGYSSTEAPSLIRPDLVIEAIRLARLAAELLPANAEARGLLALMLLTDARRAARTTPEGDLVALDEQDRTLWNREQIEEGTRTLDEAIALRSPGPYQIQAAIAALHGAASTADATDWPQIAELYKALLRSAPSPIVELNAAVAHGLATSLEQALTWIGRLDSNELLRRYHHLPAAKGEILRRLGRKGAAAEAYGEALMLVTNSAERRYLEKQLAGCRLTSEENGAVKASAE